MEPLDATSLPDNFRKSRNAAADLGLDRFEYRDETDSTNADALRAIRENPATTGVFVAGHQSQGRGRLDRRWHDDGQGQLMVSFVLDCRSVAAAEAMGVVSVAVCDAAIDAGADAGVKWPNDVVLRTPSQPRKIAGILAELHAGPPTRLVVGVGVNLFSTPTPNGACLADHGEITSADEFLSNVIIKLASLNDSSEATLERYRQRSVTLSTDVRVEQPHRSFHGTAIDIDGEYRLVVDRHGQTEVVDVGDVIHLRPASGVS